MTGKSRRRKKLIFVWIVCAVAVMYYCFKEENIIKR